ncbi:MULTISPECIES: hypothetical protein [Acinetobacter]|jgi:hypothetical protein|uniref:Uncharacterized protein n=1 Tax=Acinetobacter pittii TaxID=48296 RepID=A0AAE9MBX3_ACIPI|nr:MULTISPECIES: hypothetical protein [Acinetobacter calcoaceticus/baumannii complex]AZP28956.1 hypothetical protein DLK06_07685 [Acinetobacter pittii]MBK0411545.1 hypothetical protein [Acinetobacter pittii]MBK1417701.1 hypothetical protein [Acinetobacter pittii]MCM5532976.1 hypothetical protein [Acinetobacter pittii]MCQ9380640.1 hypothetical protein [Acinetobacter pittii]
MIDLMPTDAKRKLREIRIVKAFIIFAFVLSLLILYIEYHNHAHISWKFVFIASLCAIYDFDLNNKIKDLKVEIKSN